MLTVCYEPFLQESTLYVEHNGVIKTIKTLSTLPELAGMTVQSAYSFDETDVKILAPLAIYNEIKNLIQEYENTTYNQNKLNIEVI